MTPQDARKLARSLEREAREHPDRALPRVLRFVRAHQVPPSPFWQDRLVELGLVELYVSEGMQLMRVREDRAARALELVRGNPDVRLERALPAEWSFGASATKEAVRRRGQLFLVRRAG